jgi:hypothetical protein
MQMRQRIFLDGKAAGIAENDRLFHNHNRMTFRVSDVNSTG